MPPPPTSTETAMVPVYMYIALLAGVLLLNIVSGHSRSVNNSNGIPKKNLEIYLYVGLN